MLMTSHPSDWNHLDSERVENRRPCTTTTGPPSWTGSHSQPCSHQHGGRRLSVRRVDVDLLDVVEERVEPGAAEHPDLGGAQADFSVLFGFDDDPDPAVEESDEDDEVEEDEVAEDEPAGSFDFG